MVMKKLKRTYCRSSLLIVLLLTITAVHANVYTSNAEGSDVTVIDPSTDTIIKNTPVGVPFSEPRNLGPSSDGTRIYVPNRKDDSVSVISVLTNNVITTITHASFDEPYAVAAKGSEIWVANKKGGGSDEGSITIINTGSNGDSTQHKGRPTA